MASLVETAITQNASPTEVAVAAAQDAASSATTDAEKQALAIQLYKEATGRFPQDSSDRRSVYTGGFLLVFALVLVSLAFAMVLLLNDKTVPDWLSTLTTALASAVIGGLLGYAKQ